MVGGERVDGDAPVFFHRESSCLASSGCRVPGAARPSAVPPCSGAPRERAGRRVHPYCITRGRGEATGHGRHRAEGPARWCLGPARLGAESISSRAARPVPRGRHSSRIRRNVRLMRGPTSRRVGGTEWIQCRWVPPAHDEQGAGLEHDGHRRAAPFRAEEKPPGAPKLADAMTGAGPSSGSSSRVPAQAVGPVPVEVREHAVEALPRRGFDPSADRRDPRPVHGAGRSVRPR